MPSYAKTPPFYMDKVDRLICPRFVFCYLRLFSVLQGQINKVVSGDISSKEIDYIVLQRQALCGT